MATRIYVVPAEPLDGKNSEYAEHFLVEATHPSVAERHIAKRYVGSAKIADPKDIVAHMAKGAKLEQAKVGKS